MKKIITFIAACASTMLSAQNQQQVIACYPLDCHAQNQTIYGSQLDGVANNVHCVLDRNLIPNGAYKFTGSTTSYIKLPNDPLLKAPKIAFSGWFRFDQLGGNQYLVFTKNNFGQCHEGFALTINSANVVQVHKNYGCNNPTNVISSLPNAITLQTKWYHIVFYIDDQYMELYIDNVFQSSLNTAPMPIDYHPNTPVILGGSNLGFNLPYLGSMDDVRFYSQQLSTQEIAVLYSNNPPCGTPKPTGIDALSSTPVSLKLFPNPSHGKFILESESELNFTVTDISGKMVAHTISKIDAHQSEITLNEAKSGLYFVNIYDQKGELIRTEKMAVME